jgi:hypothetical protein
MAEERRSALTSPPRQAVVRGGVGEFQPALAPSGETGNEERGPLPLIAGGRDHTIPEVITRAKQKQYRHSSAVADLIEFPGSLTRPAGRRQLRRSAA